VNIAFLELYIGLTLSLERWRRSNAKPKIWSRIAFVTRYGHITLTEALTMPVSDLNDYSEALADLIEEENRALKPNQ
jgi:hypothetical protein